MRYTNDIIKQKINKKDKIKKVIRIIVYIIVVPIIFYNISLIAFSIINKNETPSFFGIKTYVIVSGSMQPNLNIGDIVIVKKQEKEEIQIGDIISYREGESIITHRVVEINEVNGEKQFVTKGDYNNVKDSNPVKYEEIEGKLISKISHLGNVILFLNNKVVIISILLIFYILYSHELKMSEKEKIRRRKRKEYEKNSRRESDE